MLLRLSAMSVAIVLIIICSINPCLAIAQGPLVNLLPSLVSPTANSPLDGAELRYNMVGTSEVGDPSSLINSLTSDSSIDMEIASLDQNVDSVAQDDFGFKELQREQQELHDKNMQVMRQKKFIQDAESKIAKLQAKLKTDKATLQDNERKLKEWTNEMIEHVKQYQAKLSKHFAGDSGENASAGNNNGASAKPTKDEPKPAGAGNAAATKDIGAAAKFRSITTFKPDPSFQALFHRLKVLRQTADRLKEAANQ